MMTPGGSGDSVPEQWQYRTLPEENPPEVKRGPWIGNGIDSFILRKLEENRLSPAPQASRRVLFAPGFL